jgi:Site-specific recombinase XerC
VQRLIDAAVNEQDRAIFAVAAFAGLRVGELRGLRWSDVDPQLSIIHVRRSYTNSGKFQPPKSGRVRSVPLIPQAAEPLFALGGRGHSLEPDDLVFLSPKRRVLNDSRQRRRFYEATERAGLPHLRLHDLRHSFGTLAVQAFPLSDVAAYMGHADIETTMIYIHHVPKADAAARLASVVSAGSAATPQV